MSAAPGEVGSEVHDAGPDACPWCSVPPGEVTAGMDSDLTLKEEQGMKDTELVKFTAGSGNGSTSDGLGQSFVERGREVRLPNSGFPGPGESLNVQPSSEGCIGMIPSLRYFK